MQRDPNHDLRGKPIQPEVRILTSAQWEMERTADAEQLWWRKTRKECHQLQTIDGSNLPSVALAKVTQRWLPHAKFDHDAHRWFSCDSCHAQAISSKNSVDISIPGIATCKTCHAPGPERVDSRCFECHTYHDWSNRQTVVQSEFRLPDLQTGGE